MIGCICAKIEVAFAKHSAFNLLNSYTASSAAFVELTKNTHSSGIFSYLSLYINFWTMIYIAFSLCLLLWMRTSVRYAFFLIFLMLRTLPMGTVSGRELEYPKVRYFPLITMNLSLLNIPETLSFSAAM